MQTYTFAQASPFLQSFKYFRKKYCQSANRKMYSWIWEASTQAKSNCASLGPFICWALLGPFICWALLGPFICSTRTKSQMAPNEKVLSNEKLGLRAKHRVKVKLLIVEIVFLQKL